MQHISQESGQWQLKSFLEQLANVGSEVHRTISWKKKENNDYSKLAFYRSLELIDLTLECKLSNSQFRELCKLREFWIDYYLFDNNYSFTDAFWEKYFNEISYAYAMKKQLNS